MRCVCATCVCEGEVPASVHFEITTNLTHLITITSNTTNPMLQLGSLKFPLIFPSSLV